MIGQHHGAQGLSQGGRQTILLDDSGFTGGPSFAAAVFPRAAFGAVGATGVALLANPAARPSGMRISSTQSSPLPLASVVFSPSALSGCGKVTGPIVSFARHPPHQSFCISLTDNVVALSLKLQHVAFFECFHIAVCDSVFPEFADGCDKVIDLILVIDLLLRDEIIVI